MKVSMIVAAYNAEKYIEETLETLVKQTLDEYEILVVNDGSTDGTLEILRTYEERYPHLRVIDKENGGPSSGRRRPSIFLICVSLTRKMEGLLLPEMPVWMRRQVSMFFSLMQMIFWSRMLWRHCMRGQ